MESQAHVLVPLLGGVVLGAVGVALGFWVRLRNPPADPSRLTFHKPAPDVVVVEVRGRVTAEQAQQLRAFLREKLPETADVLVVVLDSNERLL